MKQRVAKQTPAQCLLAIHLKELGIDTLPEHQFHSERKWRFDLAAVKLRLAFECNGHYRGRHGAGWSSDAEKLNTAQMMGWRVLVFSNRDILTGKAKLFIQEHLAHEFQP